MLTLIAGSLEEIPVQRWMVDGVEFSDKQAGVFFIHQFTYVVNV